MRRLRPAELVQLAELRGPGIYVEALEAAVKDGRLGYADWPCADTPDGRDGRSKPSWVVTDERAGRRNSVLWTALYILAGTATL